MQIVVIAHSTTTTHLLYLEEGWQCYKPALGEMGKPDKSQQKLEFDQKRTPKAQNEGAVPPEDRCDVDMDPESDLKQILKTMQQSLTKIYSKIDALTFRMDRMLDRLNKHADYLGQAERRLPEAKAEQVTLAVEEIWVNKL
ncbi:hypothetical protein NDU88_004892 [Pleurodeles waltl]|uniref:Uncharacterized protein n=1 Tax=Pleurodeles waltl TaxID=8319 RepID=A0AAV7QDS5_PLEWA|nr:hypothetical protein NDU88_004892 [Pleurodeles waltl]